MFAIYRTDAGFKENDSFVLHQGENRAIIAVLKRVEWDYKIHFITECCNNQLTILDTKKISIVNKQKELKEFYEDFKKKIPYNTDGDKIIKPTFNDFKKMLNI